MNPKEQEMLERIGYESQVDFATQTICSPHWILETHKLARVLVEMEEKIDLKFGGLQRGDVLTEDEAERYRQGKRDGYLTALDDVEKKVKPVKEPLLMTKNVLEVIDDLRKKHKE